MDNLSILQYGGITVLIVLLIVFEVKNKQSRTFNNDSYIYYTYNNVALRIKRIFASRYKVYVSDYNMCPMETKRDRYGTYFSLKAKSASDVEYQIDELYKVR